MCCFFAAIAKGGLQQDRILRHIASSDDHPVMLKPGMGRERAIARPFNPDHDPARQARSRKPGLRCDRLDQTVRAKWHEGSEARHDKGHPCRKLRIRGHTFSALLRQFAIARQQIADLQVPEPTPCLRQFAACTPSVTREPGQIAQAHVTPARRDTMRRDWRQGLIGHHPSSCHRKAARPSAAAQMRCKRSGCFAKAWPFVRPGFTLKAVCDIAPQSR